MTGMRNTFVFGLGLATALLAGWILFPHALYVREHQPVAFYHKTHAEKSGIAECGQCHALNVDGAVIGMPPIETCATCHSEPIGKSHDEAILVNSYVKAGKEVPWLVYAKQPANVWFSHAIHVRLAGLVCTECHSSYGKSDQARIYEQDRLSGYSRDTMTMSNCENCHRRRHVQAGCLACHQ